MIDVETELLIAVAHRLREVLGLSEPHVSIGLDDIVPAIAGKRHFLISPLGVRVGPHHRGSGGAIDLYVDVRVVVYHRMTEVPRDRHGSVFLDRSRGLNHDLAKVATALDYRYDVINAANHAMQIAPGGGFIEPLRLAAFDARPQAVSSDVYDAAASPGKGRDPALAMKRGAQFQWARFTTVRT